MLLIFCHHFGTFRIYIRTLKQAQLELDSEDSTYGFIYSLLRNLSFFN